MSLIDDACFARGVHTWREGSNDFYWDSTFPGLVENGKFLGALVDKKLFSFMTELKRRLGGEPSPFFFV